MRRKIVVVFREILGCHSWIWKREREERRHNERDKELSKKKGKEIKLELNLV